MNSAGTDASVVRRMSTQSKKKHFKAVSQKVKLFRANEPQLSVFMWGVNHTINALSHVNVPIMLMPDDFKAFTKTRVDNHCFNKENMPSHFRVKEYCPIVFRNLRERFDIDDTDYVHSLTKAQPVQAKYQGRGGGKLLVSQDRRFLIKTIDSEDVEQMHSILKPYHQYVVESHGETLLPQYLGMYRVTVDGAETYLLVMRNFFSQNLQVHRIYDLKGSTVDRKATEKEKSKSMPTYKDNDFMEEEAKIYLGKIAKDEFLQKLTRDVEFLTKLRLMDYSLLVGIHDGDTAALEAENHQEKESKTKRHQSETETSESDASPPPSPNMEGNSFNFDLVFHPELDKYGFPSTEDAPKKQVYFMALIEVLTEYGASKRTAHAVKTVKHGTGAEISTVSPEQYSRRLVEFMTKAIE